MCISFCEELEDFMEDRNCHRIRPVAGANSPGGIPDDLYDMPVLQGVDFIPLVPIVLRLTGL